MRVEDGALSVVGAKFVEGPLATAETVSSGLAYDVTIGARSVATGWIADAGVWRSYPDPLGRPGLQRHHITSLPSYEIAVRVPRRELSISALPKARIALYRVRGAEPVAPVGGRPLKAQMKTRVDTIATLDGIRLSGLPRHAQAELRGALK